MKKVLRFNDFIKEEADYRNVTGYGSMGNPDSQNAGPSFNKGADSETYGRPTVIGVERDTIEDPYFNQGDTKRRRVKKHPHVEKTRKNKSKYLRDVDRKTFKNRVDEAKKYTLVEENSVVLKDLVIKHNNDLDWVAYELNDRFSGKWVKISIEGEVISILFKTDLYKKLGNFVTATNCTYFNAEVGNFPGNFPLYHNMDTITEVNLIEPKRIYSESDPLGEEDWDDDEINEGYSKTNNEVKVSTLLRPRSEWERPSLTGYADFAFEDASNDLTDMFKNKWVSIEDESNNNNNIYKVLEFKPNLLGNKIVLHYSYKYNKKHGYKNKNNEGITLVIKPEYTIHEMKYIKNIRTKTQHDPYGEENWDI